MCGLIDLTACLQQDVAGKSRLFQRKSNPLALISPQLKLAMQSTHAKSGKCHAK
jgi:hypothetical protein